MFEPARQRPVVDNGYWRRIQKHFLLAIGMGFLLLQILFLANLTYLYGTIFKATSKVHNFNVLFVDYDDSGVIGQSVLAAYEMLKAPSFPTLIHHPVSQYPGTEHAYEAVCRGDYWATVYTHQGASERLAAAVTNETVAETYSQSPALSYVWNGARYSAFAEGYIMANLQKLIAASRVAYGHINGTGIAQTAADLSKAATVNVLMDPLPATEINIKPTTQGTRIFYNTVSMEMPILQQFFFLMALNGISSDFHLFHKLSPVANSTLRTAVSTSYTLIASLCTTGYIWYFRDGWSVTPTHFTLTWMVLWLYMAINFNIMDIATAYIDAKLMPFFMLTWLVVNAASSLAPLELCPRFFRWGYALPTHETYQLLIQIWSGDGCMDRASRALPILFAWWVVGTALAVMSVYRRCAHAVAAERSLAGEGEAGGRVGRAPGGVVGGGGKGEEQDRSPRSQSQSMVLRTVAGPEAVALHGYKTQESIRLQRRAYGPSYPTPFVRGEGL
ncbi:hypothetical protein FQN53_002124 [Emmonsiellopsis sp. PD_33]|nr:hypothetical protein FQN53_002124 [Emmonsiellopsis sp. PD_33]